jgi:hypothetical protein
MSRCIGKNISVIFASNNRLYLASFMIYAAAVVDFLMDLLKELKSSTPLWYS